MKGLCVDVSRPSNNNDKGKSNEDNNKNRKDKLTFVLIFIFTLFGVFLIVTEIFLIFWTKYSKRHEENKLIVGSNLTDDPNFINPMM